MTAVDISQCPKFIRELADDDQRARLLDSSFPGCACEGCSVGYGTPGPVSDDEELYRILVTPADIDPTTDEVFSHILQKAYRNGLSLFRGDATDDDIAKLVADRLSVPAGKPTRTVLGLFRVSAKVVRSLTSDGQRLFCVYDETVPRKHDPALPHVTTHVSIYQRLPAPGTEGLKRKIRSDNHTLFKLITADRIPVADFRSGLLIELNKQSLAGAFTLKD